MGALGAWFVSYKPQIDSRAAQGENTGDEALREGETANGGTNIDVEAQELKMMGGCEIERPIWAGGKDRLQ